MNIWQRNVHAAFVCLLVTGLLLLIESTDPGRAASSATPATRHSPILGSKAYDAPYGSGWGTYKPRRLYNGGDPSGDVYLITWKEWGQPTASGIGRVSIFKPEGGYYKTPATIELRISDLGKCVSSEPLAYRTLYERVPTKPGGSFGPWIGPIHVCINPATS